MDLLFPEVAPKAAKLVIHSWWGLTQSFRDYGACLAADGYAVGLADLFDGRTAHTEAEARSLRAAPRRTPMYKTLAADLDSLRGAAGGRRLKTGVVGFSMGGHWSIWLLQRPQYSIAAAALYHAARGGDFTHSHARILAHFADQDAWLGAGARRRMEKAIRAAPCTYHVHDYPGTQHWFAENRRAEYDPTSACLALARDRRHFRACL